MSKRRIVALTAGLLALAGISSSCEALKDPLPFDQQVVYSEGSARQLIVQPLTLEGDASFGTVTVANETDKQHGFAIDELAVFEKIPAGKTMNVDVQEAKDNTTYEFYCHVHGKSEFQGKLVIKYIAEEERR